MRRFIKSVMFRKSGRDGNGPAKEIVTIRVPGFKRILNAPRAVIHIDESYCRPVKFGF